MYKVIINNTKTLNKLKLKVLYFLNYLLKSQNYLIKFLQVVLRLYFLDNQSYYYFSLPNLLLMVLFQILIYNVFLQPYLMNQIRVLQYYFVKTIQIFRFHYVMF